MKLPDFQNLKTNALSIEWRTKAFVWMLVFGCIVAILFYWALVAGLGSLSHQKAAIDESPIDHLATIEIEAKSAFVWDVVNQKPLFERQADTPRPLASLAKVMTALTASAIAPDLSQITIRLPDLHVEGDSYLKVASTWNKKDLIDYVLLVSSNDGAHALAANAGLYSNAAKNTVFASVEGSEIDVARSQFIKEMNNLGRAIGLTGTTFLNEHGLDNGDKLGGAYGTARDMALLFEYTLKNYPHVLEATRYSELQFADMNDYFYRASNTNTIINSVPSPVASKTGYTTLAGGNLVVAYDAGLGRPIIISILGSTQEGRFTDMIKLIDATMQVIQN